MVDAKMITGDASSPLVDFIQQTTPSKKVSRLANTIYTKFVKDYLPQISATHRAQKMFFEAHLSGFSITFIQAFDSILLTGASHAQTLEEWETLKKPMKMALVNLARIPTNIQE